MFRKRIGKIVRLGIVLLLSIPVFAVTAKADYYYSSNEIGFQQSPALYDVKQVISDLGAGGMLDDPTDMFIDKETGWIYILDSGNSRIVVLDKSGKYIREYSGTYGKDNLPLNKPQGLFIDKNDIYIADTENSRIVHIGKDGNFVEEFFQPTEDTYDTSYPFKPIKIAIDDKGVIYVANSYDWHGLLTIDAENKFLGYIAASKIEVSFIDRIVRIFATPEQKEQLAREVPPYFSNFVIAPDGFIYSVSYWAKEDQVKKLTPSGNNCFPSGFYGEENELEDFNGLPGLVDVAVDELGFVYAADGVTNKICVYDQSGNNVAVFGGSGNTLKKFGRIASICTDAEGNLYVLDGALGIIQIVEPTDFMRQIQNATYYTNSGEYDKAYPIWEKVKEYDTLHYLANIGIAKAKYRDGELTESMQIYKDQYVKDGYSEVFEDYRLMIFRDNFVLIIIGIIAVLAGVLWSVKKVAKYADRIAVEPLPTDGKWNFSMYGRLSVLMIFHPIDAFDKIKQNRRNIRSWPVVLFVLLIIITRIANIYLVHFPLRSQNLVYTNWWQQIAVFFIPLVSWIFMSYALSVTSEGKQTMGECLTASFMCFIPYIVLSYPLAAVSYLMDLGQYEFFFGITSLVMFWCIMLLLTSGMRMNEFSFGKVIWMAVKSVFGMLCLWMIIFLFYIVLYQFWEFVTNIYFESSLLFI